MLLRSPGPISPDTYTGHIRRRLLSPNKSRNGFSQRSRSFLQSSFTAVMVGSPKTDHPGITEKLIWESKIVRYKAEFCQSSVSAIGDIGTSAISGKGLIYSHPSL